MFLAKIVKKLIWSAIGLVIVVTLGIAGYFMVDDDDEKKNVDVDNVKRNLDQQQTSNNDSQDVTNNPSNSGIVVKPMYNLPPASQLPLQQYSGGTYKEGIYYFTEQNPVNLSIDPGYNAWLIQLPSKLGKRVQVERIEKSGINYDIYVNLRIDNSSEFAFKPSFGFFQVKKLDMPTYGKFRIFDVDNPGRPIWPKQ